MLHLCVLTKFARHVTPLFEIFIQRMKTKGSIKFSTKHILTVYHLYTWNGGSTDRPMNMKNDTFKCFFLPLVSL